MAKASQAEIEASIDPDARAALRQLIDDYKEATKIHTRYPGGPNLGILAELIQRGWRRRDAG
jgi:hypothetical protein